MKDSTHLSEEMLITAALTPGDLPADEARHLESCPRCQKALGELDSDLAGLGQAARQSVVVPPRRFSLADEQTPATATTPQKWRRWGSAAAGLAVAAALIIFIWPTVKEPGQPLEPGVFQMTEMESPAAAEGIYWQPEDAFSDFEQFVMAGEQPALDDDFMDFVAPPEEGQNLSKLGWRRSC